MKLSDRLVFWLKWIFLILILTAVVMTGMAKEWQLFAFSIAAFFLMFLPGYYQRKFDVSLPNSYEITILVFIFASLYLGEVYDFYEMFHWWDVMLHTFSGVLLFIFAMSILIVLDRAHRVMFRSPVFVVLFGFSFAMGLGGIWEIVEYALDQLAGFNMQSNGSLDDTMLDLINDAMGAGIAAFFVYFDVKLQWKDRVVKFWDRRKKKRELRFVGSEQD